MISPREQSLTERLKRMLDMRKAVNDEITALEGDLAAERVKRIAALDARIAEREEHERRMRERMKNPPHFQEAHEDRHDREAS